MSIDLYLYLDFLLLAFLCGKKRLIYSKRNIIFIDTIIHTITVFDLMTSMTLNQLFRWSHSDLPFGKQRIKALAYIGAFQPEGCRIPGFQVPGDRGAGGGGMTLGSSPIKHT